MRNSIHIALQHGIQNTRDWSQSLVIKYGGRCVYLLTPVPLCWRLSGQKPRQVFSPSQWTSRLPSPLPAAQSLSATGSGRSDCKPPRCCLTARSVFSFKTPRFYWTSATLKTLPSETCKTWSLYPTTHRLLMNRLWLKASRKIIGGIITLRAGRAQLIHLIKSTVSSLSARNIFRFPPGIRALKCANKRTAESELANTKQLAVCELFRMSVSTPAG